MGMMLAVSRNAKMVGNEEAIEEQQIIEEQPITENADESNN
jgi:hypothetical protein